MAVRQVVTKILSIEQARKQEQMHETIRSKLPIIETHIAELR